ncbi:hypothetical protein N204_03140 [Helicobacter pylori UM085]|nr:hypothetical protein N204_08390 [Helicobacter pylori UM085]EPZ96949.1 hypothetical protein N204_07495 [Helicobacter pylori UM085]EPZ97975.1 hypothetical protein N204_04290 [Helicobacter pylori UM085]EPZ98185.1 hypothetical protein N204_03140 [Helicobacter pylori UM085]
MVNDALILRCVLSSYLYDVFYSAMCFIFIYLRLYLFNLKLYSYPFTIISKSLLSISFKF